MQILSDTRQQVKTRKPKPESVTTSKSGFDLQYLIEGFEESPELFYLRCKVVANSVDWSDAKSK